MDSNELRLYGKTYKLDAREAQILRRMMGDKVRARMRTAEIFELRVRSEFERVKKVYILEMLD